MLCFLFQGAAEDPQMALALNLDPVLTKKSDAEGARMLFPESELSIRIGRAGLLSGKLPAADRELSQTGETGARGGRGGRDVPAAPSCLCQAPTSLSPGAGPAHAPPLHVGSPNHLLRAQYETEPLAVSATWTSGPMGCSSGFGLIQVAADRALSLCLPPNGPLDVPSH